MKLRRHEKILELIHTRDVDTQEELQRGLKQMGFDVTQATISRDIKELRLIKTLTTSGKYKYSTGKTAGNDISSKFHALFADHVVMVAGAGNLVVIKTMQGMAQAVCASMDALNLNGVVGTLAGEDTVFVACATDAAAQVLSEKLRELIAKS